MNRLNTLKKTAREQAGYLFLLAVMITGSGILLWSEQTVNIKVALADEEVRPAEVELTLLTVPDCSDCFDLSAITKALGDGPLDIQKMEEVTYNSEEGKALVSEYLISTVPTVIIRGEIEKGNAKEFLKDATDLKDDALVWSTTPPVFVDATTGKKFGRVIVTMINDKTCEECYDTRLLENIIRNNYGVQVSESLSVDRYSDEGRKFVEAYGIKGLPTLVLSSDALAYKELVGVWPSVGTIEKDGTFIFRGLPNMGYVYRDLETGKIIQPVTNN